LNNIENIEDKEPIQKLQVNQLPKLVFIGQNHLGEDIKLNLKPKKIF